MNELGQFNGYPIYKQNILQSNSDIILNLIHLMKQDEKIITLTLQKINNSFSGLTIAIPDPSFIFTDKNKQDKVVTIIFDNLTDCNISFYRE